MHSIVERLKERKLIQWALAYIAGAWLLLQIADTLGPRWGMTDGVARTIDVLLVVGFVATLIFSWYHGEKGRQRVSGPELLMLATLMVIAGAALELVQGEAQEASSATPDPTDDALPPEEGRIRALSTVAVLPFDNFSPDPGDAYFAAGITEEITSQLSRIGDLTVLSRVAVERALQSDESLEGVATSLGAGSVLEGSVRMADERVRITAQLIDVRSNQHLWSQDFDRELDDIFAIQSDVALAIGNALRATLTEGERRRVEAPPTDDVGAYQLYLRQTDLLGNVPEQNREGMRLLREALELDPDFSTARARLAWRYVWQERMTGNAAMADTAEVLALQALDRDPGLPAGHYALASAYLSKERAEEARSEFHRTLDGDPNHRGALTDGSLLDAETGDLVAALDLAFRAVPLDPNNANTRWHAVVPLLLIGDDARAAAWLELAREEGLESGRLEIARVQLAILTGALDRARQLARSILDRYEAPSETRSWAISLLVVLGDWHELAQPIEDAGRTAPGAWRSAYTVPRTNRTVMGFVLTEGGRGAEAERAFEGSLTADTEAIENGSDYHWRWVDMAAIHAYRGATDEALTALERAFEAGYLADHALRIDPMFEAVDDDPRFQAILRRMAALKAQLRADAARTGVLAGYDEMIARGPVRIGGP